MTAQSLCPCPLPMTSRHYLLRNNVMVPLVPVDQLPFQLQGVPRQLSHRQMAEEGWKFVDESREQVSLLTLLAPTAPLSQSAALTKPKHLPPDYDIRRELVAPAKDGMQPTHASRAQPATTASSASPPPADSPIAERPTALSDRFARFEYRLPYPSGIEPDPAKKVYCTHWIRTGECAFTSVGCKYKHEMPQVEKLRQLGFTLGTPKWFQEKAAIAARGPTWMQRRLAEKTSSQESADVVTPEHVPTQPSTLRSRSSDTHSRAHQRGPALGVSVPPSSLRPTLPLESTKPIIPSTSCIPDLLIDIDDSSLEDSAPTPSTQSSNSSSSSTESEVLEKSSKKMEQSRRVVRCCSPVSLTSESEEEFKVTKPLSKRNATAHKLATRSAVLSKQTGLSGSKHAASGKECHSVHSARVSSTRRKNSMTRALGVQTKATPLKQRDVHHKEKTGRSTATRIASKAMVPVKKTAV